MQIIISSVTIVSATNLNLLNIKKFLFEKRGNDRNSFEQWKYNKDAIKNFLKISGSYFLHCNRSFATFSLSSFNKNSVQNNRRTPLTIIIDESLLLEKDMFLSWTIYAFHTTIMRLSYILFVHIQNRDVLRFPEFDLS